MRFVVYLPVFAIAAVACGGAPKSHSGPSTLSGAAALSSFPSAPSKVVATDERGSALSAAITAEGQFSLDLPKGHTYKLALSSASGDVSLVFPRSSGKLDKSFVLRSDGAKIVLGSVHYLVKAPSGGFHVMSKTTQSAGSDQGNCVDCVNDDQQTSCEGGGDEGNTSEGTSSESESNKSKSESNTTETVTAEADTAEQADANQEMAVGDQNAPDQVDGCEGDGAGGDTTQQEGEH